MLNQTRVEKGPQNKSLNAKCYFITVDSHHSDNRWQLGGD